MHILGVSNQDEMIWNRIGMTLIYLLKGSLPWQGLNGSTKAERYRRIVEKKEVPSRKMLCDGLTEQFYRYMKYVKQLGLKKLRMIKRFLICVPIFLL